MQEYLQKTHLGAVMDEIGGILLLLAGSLLGYVLLWGLHPAAVLAGLATFALAMLLRARTREKRLQRREARLRRRIGGEMKLEAWTVCPPRRAHFETALLLSTAREICLERTLEDGVLCSRPGEGGKTLVACAQLHAGDRLNARDIASFQRACRRCGAEEGWLCGAGAGADAWEQAELSPRVSVVSREEMIALAGAAAPAGDRQLVELARRKRLHRRPGRLLHTVLEAQRAEKYLLYGLLLLGLYLLLGQAAYLLPALACLALMTLCRVYGGRMR